MIYLYNYYKILLSLCITHEYYNMTSYSISVFIFYNSIL